MSLNIVFAGTPPFAAEVLTALLQSKHRVIAVLTQPDRPQGRGQKMAASPVKTRALEHNIPVLQPVSLKDPIEQQALRELKPDIMIVVAYGLLLPQAVLDIPKHGCINVHASLLPRWRGAAPIQHALLAGDATTGITIMQMDKGLDTGDILNVAPYTIKDQDTAETLHDHLAVLGTEALLKTLEDLEAGKLSPQKQDNALANYAGKIQKQDAKILWQTESAEQIARKVRAFNPWPIAFFDIQGERVRVFAAEVLSQSTVPVTITVAPIVSSVNHSDSPIIPGTILQISANGIDVATLEGTLRLLTLQLPGRKVLPVKDILHAHQILFTKGLVLQ